MKANLLIALSDRRTQETLTDLIDREKGAEVTVHTLRDPFTLLQTVKSLRPDIVIVSCNVCSPPMIETVRTIADLPKARFILYCETITDELLAERCEGHLSAEESDKEVIDLITSLLTADEREEVPGELTLRERDIIIGVVKGMTNKEIADELFISPNTVTTHRRNIVKKLDIHSASGLTVYAIMNKLVSLQDIEI
ncbi:MAG: LuxR C-terminal-related transcriptional regulator [Porphyromonas sp.]|uniref:response regulator transcription factor n=1 Tax=Porphyromonas sp. TaxID=1924944 RepID=UPI002A910263|nr:LuxR C-terminal-related transcriptional regulator [Porphyromonas sp.]MDD7468760.1 LuxR C-terminal-related transcriptional regulator [Bacteroidales bacterium]MDY6101683.1 LuxR C-terminal-related transcriptional regulator [Porphyromonas sp.]